MSEVIDTIPQSKLRNPLFNAIWSLDSSGNPVGLVGPDGNLFMEFVDVGDSSASATVEV